MTAICIGGTGRRFLRRSFSASIFRPVQDAHAAPSNDLGVFDWRVYRPPYAAGERLVNVLACFWGPESLRSGANSYCAAPLLGHSRGYCSSNGTLLLERASVFVLGGVALNSGGEVGGDI